MSDLELALRLVETTDPDEIDHITRTLCDIDYENKCELATELQKLGLSTYHKVVTQLTQPITRFLCLPDLDPEDKPTDLISAMISFFHTLTDVSLPCEIQLMWIAMTRSTYPYFESMAQQRYAGKINPYVDSFHVWFSRGHMDLVKACLERCGSDVVNYLTRLGYVKDGALVEAEFDKIPDYLLRIGSDLD